MIDAIRALRRLPSGTAITLKATIEHTSDGRAVVTVTTKGGSMITLQVGEGGVEVELGPQYVEISQRALKALVQEALDGT